MAFALLCMCACGPSIDDSVRKLGAASKEERETGRQELLLAKDRAVAPLLEALENPHFAAGRPGADSLVLEINSLKVTHTFHRSGNIFN